MTSEAKEKALQIAVVDDHPLTRFALRTFVAGTKGWTVCFECDSPTNFLARLPEHTPDVVIIDLCFAGESGLELLKKLKESHPDLRTLVYSGNSELQFASRCFRLGASGYVCKDQPLTDLREAIECVMNDFVYVSDRLTAAVAHEAKRALDATQQKIA